MNKLIIGLGNKTAELETKPGFLLIDDGTIADEFRTRFTTAKLFNPLTHGFNPLPMDYREAREFAAVVFGEAGKDTLTVRNGKRSLTRMLMAADSLTELDGDKRSDADKEAMSVIDDLLVSPVLKKILTNPAPRWLLSGSSVIARINRAELGEHDARILGALLISQFKGQIIVPDFGFYAREFHASLIRENRLIAGVYTLNELDRSGLREMCLLMEKTAAQCTYDDAAVLAKYEGLMPSTNAYNARVEAMMAA